MELIFLHLFLFSVVSAHWRYDFTYDMLQFLNIRRCIMLLDLKDVCLANRMRHLASNNVYTIVMDDHALSDHLFADDFPAYKEAVVGDFDSMQWSRVMAKWPDPAKLAKITWIIFYSGKTSALENMTIPYDCLFILAKKTDAFVELHEVYHVKGRMFYKLFGTWDAHLGLDVSKLPFYRRRYNLQGSQLSLLRMQESICVHVTECAHVELWYTMGRMMNYSTYAMTAMEAVAKPWLDPDATSQVTSFHAYLLSRDPYLLDSMAPIWRYTVYIYVKHERDETSPFSAYCRPFSVSIWICLLGVLILASSCLFIISWSRGVNRANIVTSAFKGFDSLCHQSGAEIGSDFSERVSILLTRLLAVAVVPSYSGAIISILTLQYPHYPFFDLNGFVEDSSYRLGAVNNTFLVGYFEYSKNPMSQIIVKYHFEDQITMPVSTDGGLKKVCQQRFAFLSTEAGLRGWTPHCKMLRIPTPAFRTFAGMHLRPYSEFRRVFFYNLMKFQSTGIIQKLGTDFKQIPLLSREHENVAFEHITPLLTILGIGILISCAVFSIEFLCKNQSTRTPHKTTKSRPRLEQRRYIKYQSEYNLGYYYF